jgi:L-alanine-DL-glutamate epimerase-like enolase superfamily enzyme
MSPFATMQGAALTGLDGPGGPLVLVEVWNAAGAIGLAALAATDGLPSAVRACRRALAPTATEPAASSWLEPSLEWAAWGAVETARADLAARVAGVPLWLWLGGDGSGNGSARAGGSLAPIAADRIGGANERGWQALERRVLDRSIDVVRVGPVAVGGPEGVRRLDAIARAWQLELALVAETGLLVSQALSAHLAMTLTTATPAPGSDSAEVPWLEREAEGSGLGVRLDRDALAATGAERILVA